MKQSNFSKKRLSATISMLLGASALSPVYAQEADTAADDANNVEIIQVSGIRGSMARSQDNKRESSGIVDAISAEEMGKFPDTNLAESLQRILVSPLAVVITKVVKSPYVVSVLIKTC